MPFLSNRAINAAGESEITQKGKYENKKMQRKTNAYHGLCLVFGADVLHKHKHRTIWWVQNAQRTMQTRSTVWYLNKVCILYTMYVWIASFAAVRSIVWVCFELALNWWSILWIKWYSFTIQIWCFCVRHLTCRDCLIEHLMEISNGHNATYGKGACVFRWMTVINTYFKPYRSGS